MLLTNRPLVLVAIAFAGGIAAASGGLCPGMAMPLALFLLGIAIPLLFGRFLVSRPLGVALCFFAAGALLWTARHEDRFGDPLSRHLAGQVPGECWVEGTVQRSGLLLEGDSYLRFEMDADRFSRGGVTRDIQGGVLVRWSKPEGPVHPGERVRVEGTWGLSLSRVNPGFEGMEDYLRRHGVHTAVRVGTLKGVTRFGRAPMLSPFYWASRLRTAQGRLLERIVHESAQEFVLTVCLGDRGRISREETQPYIDTGTAHIFAVSGVHISIVFLTASALFRLLLRSERKRAVATIGVVFLFALMAGAWVSSVRAATMFGVYVLADLFGRERDAPTALSIAGLAFLMVNPGTLFDAGFQLSFLSVTSVMAFSEWVTARLARVPRLLRGSLAITLSVQAIPLPLAVRYFHVLPLAAPLANLIVVPLLAAALWLCFFTSVVGFVNESAGNVLGDAFMPLVWLIESVGRGISTMRFLRVPLTTPTLPAMAGYWTALALTVWAVKSQVRRRRHAVFALLVAGVTVLCWRPWTAPAEIVFLDVGAGDSIFIRTAEGGTMLIDGGDRSPYHDMGRQVVAPFLWSNGVGHVDHVVVTHNDQDHMGGLIYVVDRLSVGEVLVGSFKPAGRPKIHEKAFFDTCARRGVPIRHVGRGDSIDLAGTQVEVLHPPPGGLPGQGVNENSVVLRLEWAGTPILLTGDIQRNAELAVSELGCRATVLKAPHHGSETSSSSIFLDAVDAPYCVVSTGGAHGREGIDEGVLQRYRACGMGVWRTDLHGAVRMTMQDGRVLMTRERELRGYPMAAD